MIVSPTSARAAGASARLAAHSRTATGAASRPFARADRMGEGCTLPTPPGEPERGERLGEALRPRVVAVCAHVARRRRRPASRAARGRRRGARARVASAPLSPAGTTRPLRPSRTSPPAAAPTASLAITGRPRFIASFTTRPHGSRKVRVAIEGITSTSLAAYTAAQLGCGHGLEHRHALGGVSTDPPGHAPGRDAGEHERGARGAQAAGAPRLEQQIEPLLGGGAPDEQERRLRPLPARRGARGAATAGAPRSRCRPTAARRARCARRARARRR